MIREEELRNAHILIVDDDDANIGLLTRILESAGCSRIEGFSDPREALRRFPEIEPDLVLLDLHMPGVDGFAVLERLEALVPDELYLPVLVLTCDTGRDVKKRALANGAKDFLTKPFDYAEVLLRIRNLLTTRRLQAHLHRQNERLDRRVRERTQELEKARREVLERLARAAEYRDDATGHHTRRVGELSGRLAESLGLDAKDVELIRLAAPLHDVGKIGIPDSILLKPGKLDETEWTVMQSHTVIGARLLSGSGSELLRMAEEIARGHHEKWDGSGYPDALDHEEIPLAARIVAAVDVYDALSSERPYRPAWPRERVLDEIAEERGRHFDPDVASALLDILAAEGAPGAGRTGNGARPPAGPAAGEGPGRPESRVHLRPDPRPARADVGGGRFGWLPDEASSRPN